MRKEIKLKKTSPGLGIDPGSLAPPCLMTNALEALVTHGSAEVNKCGSDHR